MDIYFKAPFISFSWRLDKGEIFITTFVINNNREHLLLLQRP